jgi:uncharacterized protein (DUF305 family)
MNKTLLAGIAVLALAVPALAQSPQDHQQHHPGGSAPGAQAQPAPPAMAQPQAQPAPLATQQPQAQMPMGQMMQNMPGMTAGSPGQGAAGQAGMMMHCPMMAAMMGGRGMGAMSTTAAGQGGDQSVASLAFRAVNDKMHRDMAIELTGRVDADFAKAMIAHHQGAVDMAKIALAFGKDPEIRKLAEEVVRTQESEISFMREWLAKQPK